MSKGTFKNLRELRERLVNLRAATVAGLAGIPQARLHEIEAGSAPSVFEIECLATVYGVDADALWDEPIRLASADAFGVLTSLDEFREVSDMTRAKILRAASAPRDLVTLRRLLGDALEPLPRLPSCDPTLTPYQQGADLAHALRVALGLGAGREETPRAVMDFPIGEVPYERRGAVAEAAMRAFARGLIPRDACARFLGVTLGSEIERIADFFGEDLPQEQSLTG